MNAAIPLNPPNHAVWRRLLLSGVAFGGSTLYALSFVPLGIESLTHWAVMIGLAAGTAWVMFGATLVAVTRGRPTVGAWMDVCLEAIRLGMMEKMGAVALNGVCAVVGMPEWKAFAAVHVAILLTADAVMGTVFCREARTRGVTIGRGLALWVALNACFVGLLAAMVRIGGAL